MQIRKEYDQWFSERMGSGCRLVFFPEKNSRPVDPNYRIGNEHVSLADGYPFLIIGEESLNNLNLKLSAPVPMNRFRPNMVFSGGKPYEEDTWRNFRIGENRFAGVKPCARCSIPTIDQDTGEMGKEPSATLSKYRRGEDGKVYFGQNVVALDHNKISIGQKIEIESYSG
ncbi:MAG: MOSC domain-containing protein [Flammeovirgaceae bacterium]|nr:MOSC domain-containing protein [Flammeovirgaceae bacterium]